MTNRSETPSLEQLVLAARKNGNVVIQTLPGKFGVMPLTEMVEQPAEGMLYDLNRLEEVVLTFIDDPKWVNDFAVAQVIRKLVGQRDHERQRSTGLEGERIELQAKIGHLEQALTAAQALAERNAKNAARYEWARKQFLWEPYMAWLGSKWTLWFEVGGQPDISERNLTEHSVAEFLDARIDAAIEGEK